jgi:hypothetical protein
MANASYLPGADQLPGNCTIRNSASYHEAVVAELRFDEEVRHRRADGFCLVREAAMLRRDGSWKFNRCFAVFV